MNTATVSASVALKQPEIRSLSLQMPGIKAAIPADPRGSAEASWQRESGGDHGMDVAFHLYISEYFSPAAEVRDLAK